MRLVEELLRKLGIPQLLLLPSARLPLHYTITPTISIFFEQIVHRPDRIGIDDNHVCRSLFAILQYYACGGTARVVSDGRDGGVEVELGTVGFGDLL